MYLADKLTQDPNFAQNNEQLLQKAISEIEPASEWHRQKAQTRQNSLVKPPGSLGKLEHISIQLASIYRQEFYQTNPKAVLAFGADHGVYEEGISTQPQEVTALAFANYAKGICSIGVLSRWMGSEVIPIDVGINTDQAIEGVWNQKIRKGTDNFTKGAAMTREEAVLSITIGMKAAYEQIDKGVRVIGLGEMGICNTSPSSAIIALLTDRPVKEVTGLGAGTLPEGLQHKIRTIEKGIQFNHPDPKDALDVLSKVGGFEIGALVGVMLACAHKQIAVVLDGFISYAAALLAKALAPSCVDYMLASHRSAEPASAIALEALGLKASLDMDMRLGEGSGAAIFFAIIDAANEVYTKVATFDNSGVPIQGCEVK